MLKRLSFLLLEVAFVAMIAVSLTGCSPGAASQDNRDERDPYLKRALVRKNMNDIDGAIDLLNKALVRKPDLARAHFEMGWLYDTRKQDYIRAIYHYERYLELRPDAEKRKLIEDLIRQARLSFVASLPNPPPGAIEQIAMLNREISALKGQVASPQGGIGPAAAAKPATVVSTNASVPMPPKPAPAQSAVQTYVVQSRDTLSSIAAKLYNDPGKWKTIYDANRNTLSSPQSVRPGQTLIIPR